MKLLLPKLRPYMILAIAGIIAYLPVSSMTLALKNDIIALEYPINYFISQCLHENALPLWFNTWALGFPLESILTWSIFSPVQTVFNFLFTYSLYTLHFEFIFFIVLCGWNMYYFLQKHSAGNHQLNVLLSCCYMLSGFNVGSSQWLLYLTASAFLPLLLSSFLSLLKRPGLRNAIVFSSIYYIHLTSVYVAFTIITTYILVGLGLLFLVHLQINKTQKQTLKRTVVFLLISFLFTVLIATPALLSSFQLLQHLERGTPLTNNATFFGSNYLHPQGLQSLFFPFSSTRMHFVNTEGTMLNSYIGLLPLLLLPAGIHLCILQKKRIFLLLLLASFIFLLIAFGNITPVRNWLNVLPGFSYFRNPALFRLYFIFFMLFFLQRSISLSPTAVFSNPIINRTIKVTFFCVSVYFILNLITHLSGLPNPIRQDIKGTIQSLTYSNTVAINSILQGIFLTCLGFSWAYRKIKLLTWFVLIELTINTLVCTPFFTVSSYSIKEVNRLFTPVSGFPIQTSLISEPHTTIIHNNAIWNNVNVYKKQISALDSYWGPLVLKNFNPADSFNITTYQQPLMHAENPAVDILIEQQLPSYIKAKIQLENPTKIIVHQNFYPGWKAYLNGKEITLNQDPAGMNFTLTSSGSIELKYEKAFLYFIALFINLFIIVVLFYLLVRKLYSRNLSSNWQLS